MPHETQRLSTSRLFLIVLVFLVLAAYSIWNSDRFQTLFQGISQQRLSELLERPVSFRRVDFRIFPPSVHLADVRIGNDPRLAGEPFFAADELTIGGGVSVTGGELRFGRIRAVHPRIALVQFADGAWNLPPGLTGPAGKGGLRVRVSELVVLQGVFRLEGREAGIDGRLEDFAAELFSLPGNRYRGTLASRRVSVQLPDAEPLRFGLDLAFRLAAGKGLVIESLDAKGDFGAVHASGSVEDFKNPTAVLVCAGDLHVAEVERVFRSELGFSGDARVKMDVRVPSGGDFRVTGHLSSRRIDAEQFAIEELEAAVLARPDALVARIERARYAGGEATGAFHIENLVARRRPQPMTLVLEGKGISLERFFGDLRLPGTGLSGAVTLSAALRWSQGGLERANGGANLSIEPGPAASIIPGRFGVPVGGGGPLTVVDGRIGFAATPFRLAGSAIEVTGGLRIGEWTPDFDFKIRSRDLVDLDRVFQNLVAAGGDRPEPLGLGGSGEIDGHIAKSWNDPDVTAQLSAENARYGGVLFGSVRGAVDMHDGAFIFHPLRVYEGGSTLSLEGTARYRKDPRPTLDLTLTAKDYPVARLLGYLDLQYPVEGRVTGSFPLSGNPPDAVTGGGVAALDDAVLWGQRVSSVTGHLMLEPGSVGLEDIRADVGGGTVGGRAAFAYRQKTFEARLAGDAIPLESLRAAQEITGEIAGRVSFELEGSGSFEKPDLTASASLSEAVFFGHPIPPPFEPKVAIRVVRGRLEGSVSAPERWSLSAQGDLFALPADLELTLDARDLAGLLLFTPLEVSAGVGGTLAGHGHLRVPARPEEKPSGEFVLTEARLETRDHPGLLHTAGDVRLTLANGKVSLAEGHAVGEGIDLRLRGTLDASGEKPVIEARLSGTTDAAVLSLALPDPGVAGRITLDMAASGPLENPALNGTVRIANGRYRLAGYSLDDIEGSLRLIGSSGEIEGVRAKVGDGEAFAAGNFRLEKRELKDFRFTVQGRRVQVRAIPELRLTVDADLVTSGNGSGNRVRGEITLLSGTYTKDVDVTISDLLAHSRPGGVISAREPWKERTSLDVRIVSAAALEVRNNLARLSGTVDLTARGTLADPVLLGQVLLDEGGRVIFSDVRYEIEAGTIAFSNTTRIAPFIDIRARAEVKGYDLVVSLVGTWPRIAANFSSDPPLSNDAILGLVLTGVPPDTRAQIDTAGQLVSAAGGVISGAVTGGLTRRTQRIFRLDRFQIDPVFQGSTLSTFRTTIGKQITPDLAVTSSIAIDSSKQPILRIEWQATDTILVQLIRDENGILSLTFRRRQRF